MKQQRVTYWIPLHREVLIMHVNHLLFSQGLIHFLSRRREGTEMYSVGRSKWWMMLAGPCSDWNCTDDGFCQFWILGWFCCILGTVLKDGKGADLYVEDYLGRALWSFRSTKTYGSTDWCSWLSQVEPFLLLCKSSLWTSEVQGERAVRAVWWCQYNPHRFSVLCEYC